jgi:hypothetical protein
VNLHNLVSNVISAINPNMTVSVKVSSGYTTNSDGSRTPNFAATIKVQAQAQPLSSNEINQLNGINIQGEKRAFYLSGVFEDLSRISQQGGDLITLPDGTVWLIVQTLENWIINNGWIKVATIQQNGS